MKLHALTAFLLFSTVSYSQPMTDAQMKEAATAMCNCMEPTIKKLHPQIFQMMKTIDEKGKKEAETELIKWFTTASANDQKVFGESLAFLETEFADSSDVCQKKTDNYFPKNSFDNLDEKEMDRFLKLMETIPNCKYMLLFLKVGIKEEEEEQQ